MSRLTNIFSSSASAIVYSIGKAADSLITSAEERKYAEVKGIG